MVVISAEYVYMLSRVYLNDVIVMRLLSIVNVVAKMPSDEQECKSIFIQIPKTRVEKKKEGATTSVKVCTPVSFSICRGVSNHRGSVESTSIVKVARCPGV